MIGRGTVDTPTSPPKYVAIYRDLRGQIERNELRAGSRLPAQQVLADRYGVTLMTLRQALAALQDEGLLRAHRGRGTFVSPRPLQYRLNYLTSLAEEMERQGVTLTTRMVDIRVQSAPQDTITLRLGIPAQTPVYEVERLRLVDGRPVLHQISYLPWGIGEQVRRRGLRDESLYDVLADEAGGVARAAETIRPIALSAEQAEILLRPIGSPALLSERISLSAAGDPLILDHAVMPGDAAVITTERVADRVLVSYRVL